MEERVYRVTMVFWRDSRNTDTDYIVDFESRSQAIDYVERHRQHFTKQALNYKCDDDVAVDMDIEEWDYDDNIVVIYSITLWEKQQ